MGESADVVVVGGGLNGLITAAYVARAGLGVIVVEETETPGGNIKSQELTLPGFSHDSGSSVHLDLMFNPLIASDELGLIAKHGLRYTKPDPMMVVQTSHEGVAKIPAGADKVAATIAEYSEHDSVAYLEMIS